MIKKLLSIFQESSLSFQGQEPGEVVIAVWRKHAFTIMFPLGWLVFLCCVPVVLRLVLAIYITEYNLGSVFVFLMSLWYLFIWLFAFYLLTIYSLNTAVLTNRRIVESEQVGFFNRKVSELHLHQIQDISVHVQGFIPTFLSFGEVAVQTAGMEREFIFKDFPHPEMVKDKIMKAVVDYRSHHKGH